MLGDTSGPSSKIYPETISDVLDRLDIPASKIGLITSEQAFELLHGLDEVFLRMQELEPGSSSRKVADAQLGDIVAKLHKEPMRFVRDLGGFQALRHARSEVNPPADHGWWYLDEFLAKRRQAAFRRLLTTGGALVILFIILAVLYNRFLAPDPKESALYGAQQNASSRLINGDYQGAMQQVDQGLQIAPQDPDLLVLKGVIQNLLGQKDQAEVSFAAAEKGFTSREDFLLARGQLYLEAKQLDKSLADAQSAVLAAPQSASAYLLRGQVYEEQQKYQEAMADYNQAFTAADKADQSDLAAIARVHIGMLTQMLNGPAQLELLATPTSAP